MAASSNTIFVTHVEDHRGQLKVWGQLKRICGTYVDKQLHQLLPEFNRSCGPSPDTIQRSSLCFAKYVDDNYYRARIISDVHNAKTVKVAFIDYGNTDEVPLSNLRILPGADESILKIVPQAEEFYLAGVVTHPSSAAETVRHVRRELCFREHNYKFAGDSNKFIQIEYKNADYASLLVRQRKCQTVPLKDQFLMLKLGAKDMEGMTMDHPENSLKSNYPPYHGPQHQVNPKIHGGYPVKPQSAPKLYNQQSVPHIPIHPGQVPNSTYNNSSDRQYCDPNVKLQPNVAVNQNNNNVIYPDGTTGLVLNNVVIEAISNQVKQHLLKDVSNNMNPDTKVHNYVTQVLNVGTTHNVYVSYIDDGPWSFSIQLVSSEHELNQLMEDLATCELIPVKLPVVLGYPCIAKSKQYGNVCRGVIVNISHSAVKVFFVDFGNNEDLPISAIYELPVRFFKVKALSQKFALSGLQKIKCSPEIKKAFNEVVENELLLLHVTTLEGENLPTCDLYLKNVNIKKILNDKVRQFMMWDKVQLPQPGQVEDVVVTWIDSPQKFYVQLKRSDHDLENLKAELAAWGVNGEAYNHDELVPGTLCICCYTGDNEWYRAIVTSVISQSTVTVFYVDFGNTETVKKSMVKKIGDGLIRRLSIQAIQCCLHGYEAETSDTETNRALEDLILERQLRMKVVSTDNNRLIVQLFDNDTDIGVSLRRRGAQPQSVSKFTDQREPSMKKDRITEKPPPNKSPEDPLKSRGRKDARGPKPAADKSNRRLDYDKRDQMKGKKEPVPLMQVMKEPIPLMQIKREPMPLMQVKREPIPLMQVKREPIPLMQVRMQGKKHFWSGKNVEDNWRGPNEVDGRRRDKPPRATTSGEGVGERLKKVARETAMRGIKLNHPEITKCPVKLEDIVRSGSKYKTKIIPTGSTKDVIVTYFMNPNEVYVHLMTMKEDFGRLMDDIQIYYSTKLPVCNNPKVGDIVVAKFKLDDVLYRAIVTEVNPLTVRYVDYGNEEVIERQNIWPMDKRFMEMETQSHKCSLPNLKPNGFDTWPEPKPEIDKIFETEKYLCKFLDYKDGVYDVVLVDSKSGKDVSDELVSIGWALRSDSPSVSAVESDKCQPIDFALLPNEIVSVTVTHVLDESEFYVRITRRWVDMSKNLRKWIDSNKGEPSFVSDGDSCIVQTDNDNWARGKVLEKRDTDSLVQLIDFGEKLTVEHDKMRPIPNELSSQPPQALLCCLYLEPGRAIISSDVVNELNAQKGKRCAAFVHEVNSGDNRLKVTLYDSDGLKLQSLRNASEAAPAQIDPITWCPMLQQQLTVVSSHITSPKEIYIQSLSDIPLLEKLNEELTTNNGGEDLAAEPTIGSFCSVKSIADSCWYRARIVAYAEESVNVFYIDFGNTEEVPRTNVKTLDVSLRNEPEFARKVALKVNRSECIPTDKLISLMENKEMTVFLEKVEGTLVADFIVEGVRVTDAILAEDERELDVGKADHVFISHVTSPSEFWIHRESISNELNGFQEKFQEACASGVLKTDVQTGDIVGVLFTDGLWYRSKVTNVRDETVTVQFIDYGHSMEAKKGELVEVPEDLAHVGVFASCCSLRGLWKKEAVSRFEEIITSCQDPFVLVQVEDSRIVDLMQQGSSVTEQLLREGYGDDDEEVEKEDADDIVYITHVNSPNDFYVFKGRDKAALDRIKDGLSEADNFDDAVDVVENEVYCIKFEEDDMWYRGRVTKRTAEETLVHFIDYGNTCAAREFKHLPADLKALPKVALNCCLVYCSGCDSWSDDACDKLQEYLDEVKLRMEVVLQGAQKSVIRLFTLNGVDLTEELGNLCEPDGREDVCVTHVNSPTDFYIRKVNDDKFERLTERLKTCDVDAKKETGRLCASKTEDGDWRRARIANICDDVCEVFHIDHGSVALSSDLKELPEDVAEVEPLARNCSLNFPVTNIPESVKEEFIHLTNGGATVFRCRVIESGPTRDVVSLIHDGRKLEEVLLFAISENSEIYNIQLDGESRDGVEDFRDFRGDEFGDERSNMEDDERVANSIENETDEEKRVKIAILDNTDGFKSDDEKGIMEGVVFASGSVNVPDNELLLAEAASSTTSNGRNSSEPDEETPQQRGSSSNDQVPATRASPTDKIVPGSISRGTPPPDDDGENEPTS